MSFATGLKTIVVATDLHGQSEAALEYARKLATNYGARIVLAHGLDPLEYADVDAVPGRVRDGPDRRRARGSGQAGRRSAARGNSQPLGDSPGHSGPDAGGCGPPIRGWTDRGRHQGNGRAPDRWWSAQSPSSWCGWRRARCWRWPRTGTPASFAPLRAGRCMLAMERNEATAAAVATAYSLATIFKRPLLVVHARTAAEASAFLNPCATTLEEFGIRTSEEVPVRCMVKDGNPADAMADAIAQYHPSILVAGVKRTSETPGPHGTAFRPAGPFPCTCFVRSAGDRGRRTGPGSFNSRGSRLAARRTGSAAWRLTGDKRTSEDIAPSNLIELICFSGLIAFGAIGRKWNMVHRTSAAPSALTKAKAAQAKAAPGPQQDRPEPSRRKTGRRGEKMEDGTMQAEARSERMEAVAAHPLAELLECPPEAGNLLNGAAQCIEFDAGEVVFRQHGVLQGALRGGFRPVSAQGGAAQDAADAGSGARRRPGGAGGRTGRRTPYLHAQRADRRARCCCCRSSR